jgi:hypothetical protein
VAPAACKDCNAVSVARSAQQQQRMQELKTAHEKGFLSDEDLQKEIEKIINT